MSEPDVCPPQLNTDIAGVGVRISFYLQALVLALLSARSDNLDEIKASLYTLNITNIAMITITFFLGFKKNPEITLHDAIVVLYLLSLSSVSIFFSTVRYDRFPGRSRTLEYLSVVQFYFFFGLALSVLVKGNKDFGMLPPCNKGARVVLFRPFDFIPVGRTIFIILVSILIVIYSAMIIVDYMLIREKTTEMEDEDSQGKSNRTGFRDMFKINLNPGSKIIGTLLYDIVAIFISWPIVVVNTELLIQWNGFKDAEGSQWTFGQVLAVFLVVIPVRDLIKAFRRLGLGLSDTQKQKRANDDENARKREISRREADWATGDGLQESQTNSWEMPVRFGLPHRSQSRMPPNLPGVIPRFGSREDDVLSASSSEMGRGYYTGDDRSENFGVEENNEQFNGDKHEEAEDYYSS